MHNKILQLLTQLAQLRFEVKREKARRYPFRVFDRISSKTVDQFDSESDADSHRNRLIDSFIQEQCNELSAESSLWVHAT